MLRTQRILCKLADGFCVKFRAAVRFHTPRCVIGLARLTTIKPSGSATSNRATSGIRAPSVSAAHRTGQSFLVRDLSRRLICCDADNRNRRRIDSQWDHGAVAVLVLSFGGNAETSVDLFLGHG